MRFTSKRDYDAIIRINRELVNEVVDTQVIIYKLDANMSKTNSYGEAPRKTWQVGVQIPALYRVDVSQPEVEGGILDFTQYMKIAFLRYECELRGIYPETGDIVEFDSRYYELSNPGEVQFFAGRVEYKHSISCDAHLTNKAALQLERPQV